LFRSAAGAESGPEKSKAATDRQCCATTGCFEFIATQAIGQVFMVFLVGQVAQLQVHTAGFQTGNSTKAIAKVDVGGDKTGGLVFAAIAEFFRNAVLRGHSPYAAMPGKALRGRLANAQTQLAGRSLVQGFVILPVLAAQPGKAG